MDLFKAALQNAGHTLNQNQTHDQVRTQLYHCTYSDEVKFIIEKAVKQVLNVYPHFRTEILEFTEKNQPRRFIEIKGIMEIDVRGKRCKVDFNMMLPSTFPNKAPYVRIINHNSEYTVDPLYKALRSPTDPKSFILNEKLESIRNWNQTSSVVNIIIESHNMMRSNFPFSKPSNSNWGSSNNNSFNSGWGVPQQESSWQNQPQTGNHSQNQGYNNQGYNNQGYNNQFGNQGYNQYGNQGFNPQIGGMHGFNHSQNSGKSMGEAIAEGQKFVGLTKKIMEKLKSEQIKAIQKIQSLEIIKTSLASEEEYLRNENQSIHEFLRNSRNSTSNDLSSLVKPANGLSEQILDISSSLKAKEDCLLLLEDKFNSGEVGFEEFMKLLRKIEEERFQEKTLLVKCVEQAGK